MPRRRAMFGIVALLGAFFASALATGTPAAHATATAPLRLTVGTLGSIGSLDPRQGAGEIAKEVWDLQYPTLTSLDPATLDTAPGVAVAWTAAPGGKGWIYKLRPGLTWSDGQPVTAQDVVYSLDHARDGRWPYAVSADGLTFLNGLTAVALDRRTVKVTPDDVDWILPSLLLHVVPEHVYAKAPDVDSNLAQLAVSDGTWRVTARTRDSVQLDAMAGQAVRQLVFRTYPDASSLIDALAHEQVDVVSGLPYADISKLEAMPGVTVDHASDGVQWVLRDRLSNETIRRAISLAIDRNALVADTADGVGTPGVVPSIGLGATWALDDSTVESLTASLDAQPQRARRLLAGEPRIERKLTISIPGGADARRVGAFVRRALSAVGVETTAVDGGDDRASSRADLVVTRNVFGDNPFYPSSALQAVACDHCSRKPRLPSTDFTTLVAIAHSTLERVTAQANLVGLFEPDVLQAFRSDHVTGYTPRPELRALIAFGPTDQYDQLIAAHAPPGEQLGDITYALGAAVLLALFGVGSFVVARVRRHLVRRVEGDR